MGNSHPIVKALEQFFGTTPGAIDSTTLGPPSTNNRYLKNRIDAAFQAGWDAHEAYVRRAQGKPPEPR